MAAVVAQSPLGSGGHVGSTAADGFRHLYMSPRGGLTRSVLRSPTPPPLYTLLPVSSVRSHDNPAGVALDGDGRSGGADSNHDALSDSRVSDVMSLTTVASSPARDRFSSPARAASVTRTITPTRTRGASSTYRLASPPPVRVGSVQRTVTPTPTITRQESSPSRFSFAPISVATNQMSLLPSLTSQVGRERPQQRVLVIECGFGRIMNPIQTKVMLDAGFQVRFVEALPSPEQPGVHVMSYLGYVQQAIEEFQPDVLVCASKGAPYMIASWETGLWAGPSVMINRHPTLARLPRNIRVVLCQGSRDETYPIRSRLDLEELIRTASPNHALLYYTGDAGACLGLAGQVCRMGDSHNQESLVLYDCLPRLVDAVLATHEPPDLHFLRSSISLAFPVQRLRAEVFLGYTPEQLMRHWVSAASQEGRYTVDVPAGSQEHNAVQAIFRANPKVPRAYDSPIQGEWLHSQILKIERVENLGQMLRYVQPQFHAMQWSVTEQGMSFEPGVHTRWAFHGSDAIDQIIRDPVGFRAGTGLRTVWGTGTYFARDAEYCCDGGFAMPWSDGTRKLVLCLLAVGMPCLGDPAFQGTLPTRQGTHRYNSAVDCLSNPEVYITHSLGAAYPAYVITFI
mmetsp:Transcript_44465/g.81184  ORF Transcript_44465/g.81184 Transcript_44465/m.81184 type:complete len:625 (+) Transcript_44465:117-1991(+)